MNLISQNGSRHPGPATLGNSCQASPTGLSEAWPTSDTDSLEGRGSPCSVQRIGEMPSRLLHYGVLVEPARGVNRTLDGHAGPPLL